MRTTFTIILLAMCLAFTGCWKKKPQLHIYCWADYIAPELIEKFEKENGCKVVYDTFDSNEGLLAKLQAGASGYDLVFPSHYVVDMLAKSGCIMELDHYKVTIMENLDKQVLAAMPDKECKWSIPYMMSYTGIGYNKEVVKDFKASWSMFNRTDLQKRATLLDDKREVIGAALLFLGLDPNSIEEADLAKAKEVINGWKKNISKLENEQYKNGLASKEFSLVMGYSGDIVQVMQECPHIGFAIPEEGTSMSCDMLCIPSKAKNPEMAYKFINFIHQPENAAKNVEYEFFRCPNSACYPLLSEELKSNPAVFISDEVFKKSRFLEDHGEKEAVLNKLWEEIKTEK